MCFRPLYLVSWDLIYGSTPTPSHLCKLVKFVFFFSGITACLSCWPVFLAAGRALGHFSKLVFFCFLSTSSKVGPIFSFYFFWFLSSSSGLGSHFFISRFSVLYPSLWRWEPIFSFSQVLRGLSGRRNWGTGRPLSLGIVLLCLLSSFMQYTPILHSGEQCCLLFYFYFRFLNYGCLVLT